MVERIRLLLEVRQLSPTQFADAIGIARPIVSHILSGRNKPSLEVVQRILAALPDLSMPWLLNGTGPMVVGHAPTGSIAVEPGPPLALQAQAPAASVAESPQSPPNSATKAAKSRQTPLQSVSSEPLGNAEAGNRIVPRRFTPAQPKPLTGGKPAAIAEVEITNSELPLASEPTPMPSPALAAATEPVSIPALSQTAQLLAGAEKPIRRIVIFYRDGSFADFQPE